MWTKFFLYLSLLPCVAFGQKEDKITFAFQLTPELTNHQNNYAYRWKDTYTVFTFNCGIQALLQYDFSNKLFFQTGLGYIPRTIETIVFFDQAAIPPPRQSFTEELVHVQQVSYRTLQMPLILSYNLEVTEKTRFYINGGIIGNFLMNARYRIAYGDYEGTYEKNVWQGHTIQLGTGFDFVISNTFWITTGISFSIVNTVKRDPYLDGQDSYEGIELTHSYQNLWIGVKIPLKQ